MKKLIASGFVAPFLFLAACSNSTTDDATTGTVADDLTLGTWSVTATCKSTSGHNVCPIDTQGGEVIATRVSGDPAALPAACQATGAHGFTHESVWVDKGCEANFDVTVQGGQGSPGFGHGGHHPPGPGPGPTPPNPTPPNPPGAQDQQLECASNHNAYTTCQTTIDNIRQIHLVRQESIAPCQEGTTFGTTGSYVWVNGGCRGLFEVTGWGGGPGPGPGPGPSPNPGPNPSGDSVDLYDQVGLNGIRFSVNSDIPDFSAVDFNDRAQSMIINRGTWEACSDAGYNGICQTFGPGSYTSLGTLAGQLSSLRQQ